VRLLHWLHWLRLVRVRLICACGFQEIHKGANRNKNHDGKRYVLNTQNTWRTTFVGHFYLFKQVETREIQKKNNRVKTKVKVRMKMKMKMKL
jgi:hypothetical protein